MVRKQMGWFVHMSSKCATPIVLYRKLKQINSIPILALLVRDSFSLHFTASWTFNNLLDYARSLSTKFYYVLNKSSEVTIQQLSESKFMSKPT